MTTRTSNDRHAVRQRWEYAVLTMDAGGNMFWVGYSGPNEVETMEHALRDFGTALGALGDKGWELVSVAQSANQQGGLDEKLYFKRPYDPARPLHD